VLSNRSRGRRPGVVLALVAGIALPMAVVGVRSAPAPVALGVAGDSADDVRAFARTTGAPAAVYQWYQAWGGRPAFDAARASAAAADGALPLLTWEPWAPGAGVTQPEYALARIAAGAHDDYVRSFARQVREWGGPLALRFTHELNAPHYPWSVGVNGNSAEHAVAAWHHVRELFAAEGATDVVWVWCVNVHAERTSDYEPLFPGDDAVDWVALDGYNGGTALDWGGWRSPREIFGASLEDLRDLSDRPVAITETGSVEEGGDKARWVHDLFDLVVDERVRVLVWFDYAKEADWRIASSPAAAAAFREEAAVEGRLGPPPTPQP
jgi:hypothetical protein